MENQNMHDPLGQMMNPYEGAGWYGDEIRPSIEQCSVCAKKFELPKDLKGPQRLIPIHVELFSSRCNGSGKAPKD
jgi:hypothetical protein